MALLYKGSSMHQSLKYITGYPANLIEQVSGLVESNRFITWFEQRYPDTHQIKSEKALFDYTMQIKQRFMKKRPQSLKWFGIARFI